MPLTRSLSTCALLLAGLGVSAEDPADKFIRHHSHDAFGGAVQFSLPTKDLGTTLDKRTGLGLGMQWMHDHESYVHRTRFEWNVFQESNPVGPSQVRSYAKNLILSFDHLFKLGEGLHTPYLVGGLGGVRWTLRQTPVRQPTHDLATTKLAVTAGIGMRLSSTWGFETRYLVSSIRNTFDGNCVQASLAWRF